MYVPDILPVERISENLLVKLEQKRVIELSAEEQKDAEKSKIRPVEDLTNIHNFDYQEATEPAKKDFLAKFKLIRKGQVELQKPIAAIFNPTAGRQNDVREMINLRLSDLGVNIIYHETKHAGHAFELARKRTFDDFSALMIIGGDGTVSEVINGMLARQDGKRLPICVVPTGYSNDFALSLGIKSLD